MEDFTDPIDAALSRAADALRGADALLFTAGAGMGVDSGLPDFRGADGFWRAYPPYRKLGMEFHRLANPGTLRSDPRLFWGFYGHRLNMYRRVQPHEGFSILRKWAEAASGDYFVFTSNVDGHFHRAGFDAQRVYECHGSIHHIQCAVDCRGRLWPADGITIDVDEETMRAVGPLPQCPDCGEDARTPEHPDVRRRWLE